MTTAKFVRRGVGWVATHYDLNLRVRQQAGFR